MNLLRLVLIVLLLQIFTLQAFGQSSYVLPYPSTMPGSIWYQFNLVKEAVQKIWYFGNFGQFSYSLRESDKYLVEAKTLFEYDQFLLGYKALKKSDQYFTKILPALSSANKQGENISANKQLLKDAAIKHTNLLSKLLKEVPEKINWKPENQKSTILNIKEAINNSILIRVKYL